MSKRLIQQQRLAGRIRNGLQDLLKNVIIRDVGVLAAGTGSSQALMVLVLPVLTRLYTPEDFSVFAVYASVLGILTVVGCLRLEIAIPIPREDGDAANLLALALCSSAIISVMVLVVVSFFPEQIERLIEQPDLTPYLWLLPLGLWLASSYAAMQYWATRKKKFSKIARTRLTQAVGGAGVQLGLGWGGAGPFGLLFGHMISSGAGLFSLVHDALKQDHVAMKAISGYSMRRVLGQYDRFPKYSVFESFANTAGIQLPVIIIAALASGPEAGFLVLAMRVIQAPMSLVGGAVMQVYVSRAPQELRAGNLKTFTTEVLNGLVKTGVGPLLFLGLVASPTFALVFGEDWRRAGELVTWMTPWIVLQFISSPISMVMHVRSWQRAMLGVQVSGFLLRLGMVGLAIHYDQQRLSEYYAISGGLFYLGCFLVFSFAAGLPRWSLGWIDKKATLLVAVWIALGLICRLLFEYAGL